MVTTRRGKTTLVDTPVSPKVRACRNNSSGLGLRAFIVRVAQDSLI